MKPFPTYAMDVVEYIRATTKKPELSSLHKNEYHQSWYFDTCCPLGLLPEAICDAPSHKDYENFTTLPPFSNLHMMYFFKWWDSQETLEDAIEATNFIWGE